MAVSTLDTVVVISSSPIFMWCMQAECFEATGTDAVQHRMHVRHLVARYLTKICHFEYDYPLSLQNWL